MGSEQHKIVLSNGEYIKVLNRTSGTLRVVSGPIAWVPEPTEEIVTSVEGNETVLLAWPVVSVNEWGSQQRRVLVLSSRGVTFR